jgi:hypothetical protein
MGVKCDSTSAYNSLSSEDLYNILREFEVLMKLVRLIKMCHKSQVSFQADIIEHVIIFYKNNASYTLPSLVK